MASATARSSGVVILMFDGVALDEADPMTRALGQRRFVGALRIGARGEVESRGQHLAPECLGRLREKDRLARQRLRRIDQRARSRVNQTPLDRVARRQRRHRGARFGRGGDGARDQVGRDERPRRVVDDDDLGLAQSGAERVRHRVLPPASAGDQAEGLSAAQVRRRIVNHRLRKRDDDLRDGRMREKCADAAVEHRAAGDRQQLLERASAETFASSSGGDDGRDLQTVIITAECQPALRARRLIDS